MEKRTDETHQKHQELYNGNQYDIVMIGDSMIERWEYEECSSNYLNELKNNHSIATMGVGGDCVENLLYRLQAERCILDNITINKCVYLMIGTNNISTKTSIDNIIEGINNIINIIASKINNSVVFGVFALPYRIDVDNKKTDELNDRLKQLVESKNNHSNKFYSFVDTIDMQNDYDDHVHFNQSGYKKWFDYLQSII